MVPEHLKRYPTKAGREALASRLGLSIDPYSQDWEWEIADADRFPEFLDAYRGDELSDDEQFSLMEILVQCVEDKCGWEMPADQVEELPEWRTVSALLRANPRLHASTIHYWSLSYYEGKAGFRVTEAMRRLCAEVQSSLG